MRIIAKVILFICLSCILSANKYRRSTLPSSAGRIQRSISDLSLRMPDSGNLTPFRWFDKKLKVIGSCLAISLFLSNPFPSFADDWTDYNRLASETWRAVDELFLDRTFNNQDWFEMRQKLVKQTYRSDKEVYDALQKSLSKLGI